MTGGSCPKGSGNKFGSVNQNGFYLHIQTRRLASWSAEAAPPLFDRLKGTPVWQSRLKTVNEAGTL